MASEIGLPVIRMGDVVREEAARRGIVPTDEGIGGMAHREREVHGPDVWARRTLELMSAERMVIDGVRSLEEVAFFRQTFGDGLTILAVLASPKTRYMRISKRSRDDDILTEKELSVRDERELRWGLGNVIALADHVIVNEGSLGEFQETARALLEEVFG